MTLQTHADSNPGSTLAARLRALPGVLLRLSLGVLAMLLMLGALLVGAVLAVGLLSWALLRGRRLAPGAFSAMFQRARGRRPGRERKVADAGPVIDVEARVVADDSHSRAGSMPQHRD